LEHGDAIFKHVRQNEQIKQRGEDGRRNRLEGDFPEAQELLVEQRQPAVAGDLHCDHSDDASGNSGDGRSVSTALLSAMIFKNTCSRSVSVSASSSIAISFSRNDASRRSRSAYVPSDR